MELVNLCHCCLERPSEKDLKASHMRLGMTETYSAMIEECFVIQLSLDNVGECGICEVCIGRLRDACYFKLQVQQSQETLQERFKRNHVTDEELSMKSETDEDETNAVTIPGPEPGRAEESRGRVCSVRLELLRVDAERRSCRAGPRTHTPRRTREPSACTDTASNIYPCDECGKGFGDKSRLRKHVHTHLPGPSAYSNKRLETPSIKHSSTSLEDRGKADQMVHTGEKSFQCSHFDHKCSQMSSLESHKRIHTKEKLFQCSHCAYNYSQKSSLECHKRIHTGEKPFQCSYCDFKCSDKSSLIRHKRIHTGEKPYECSRCEYKCSDKSNLERHKRIHTGEKPYKCSHCDYKCNFKSNLENHKRIHTGEKPFQCSHCDYNCSQKSSLESHKKIHAGEKPFQCSHCDFKCSEKLSLVRHKRVHTGEKPFECSRCEYKSSDKSNLERHKR